MAERPIQMDRERFLREYTEWVNDKETRTWRFRTPAEEAAEILSDSTLAPDRRVELATRLGWIGPFLCSEGAIVCFTEPLEGWKLMKRGWLYQYWDPGGRTRRRICCFCGGLAWVG